MWSISACFILKSTKYLMVALSTACDSAVCQRICTPLSGGDSPNLLSGSATECFLREFYDHSGISPGSGKKDTAEGYGLAGKTEVSETQGRAEEQASGVHAGIPGNGRIFERA